MQQIAFLGGQRDARMSGIDRIKAELEMHRSKEILFHIYTGVTNREFLLEVIADLKEAFPDSHIAGAVSNGEIKDGHQVPNASVLISCMLFDTADIRVHMLTDVSSDPEGTAEKIYRLISGTENVRGVEFLHVARSYNPHLVMEKAQICDRTIHMFGGVAAGHDIANDPAYVISEEGVYEDAVVMVLYVGRGLWIDSDRTAGWNRLGQAFSVTKAEGNFLIEVNDKPAVHIYDRYLQIPQDENFVKEAAEFPLMLLQDGEQMLRHPVNLADQGSLQLAGDVRPGSRLYITYGNPSVIIEEVNRRCENVRQFEPQAVLLYSCAVRKQFWEDFVDNELEPFGKIAPCAGFFTGGEILRNMRTGKIFTHNITLLSIAMREGMKTGNKAPRVAVDDTMLKGQASLVRRLAKLVKSTMDEVLALNDRLSHMATTDELTNLYNRREIEHRIVEAIAAAREAGEPVSLVMLDIDHFKNVNDTYGHDVGDQVLRNVSAILRNATRQEVGYCAGRWGGEEFFVLLPDTDVAQAEDFAERVRKTVESFDFKKLRRLTASFGVITPPADMPVNSVFKAVDDALYSAKENGRNQVVLASVNLGKND